jgi:hypothetical protein
MFKKINFLSFLFFFLFLPLFFCQATQNLNGKILLQVESKGESWYINPTDGQRYYLGRPSEAFEIMRFFGLGISNNDFNNLNISKLKKLSGRILLKVEDSGKAYYVNPNNFNLYYLGRPTDAFRIMKELGLGVKNEILYAIQEGIIKKTSDNNLEINDEEKDPKSFSWEYKNKEYSVIIDVNNSFYQKYKESQKDYIYYGTLKSNWLEEYYAMFLKAKEGDKSIDYLAEQFKKIALDNNFNKDQLADLAVSFIQAITYNQEKANYVLSGDSSAKPNYPYETLYQRTGVCSDKTFLGYVLLKKLGFGVAIFDYSDIQHMALAISCSPDYSTYENNNYCYIESTNFFPIGVVPKNISSGLALNNTGFDDLFSAGSLNKVIILNKTSGLVYEGVAETRSKAIRAKQLKILIDDDLEELNRLKEEIEERLSAINNYSLSLKNTDSYKNLINEYNTLINSFNLKTKLYNTNIKEYNSIIKEFYNK